MKIVLLIVGIPLVVVILIFVVFMFRIILWGQITDLEVKFSIEKAPLFQGATITEISKDEDSLPRQKPSAGDFPGGQEMLLSEDGTIPDEKRVYDNDPRIEINVLWGQPGQQSLAFKGNEVFNINDSKAGIIVNVQWENENLILTGDPSRPSRTGKPRLPARVWQIQLPKRNPTS